MPFISIPNTVLVRLYVKTAVAELKASVSLYFSRPDFTKEDMQDLLNDLEADFVPLYMQYLNDDYNAYRMEAYDMRSVDGYKLVQDIDVAGGTPGTDTPLSPATCLVVSFYGDKRGKWNQGRNYVAGISEQDADQVDITANTVAGVLIAYNSLITSPPSGWTWVIVSRYLNKLPRAVGATTPVQTALVRSPRFGFQRRRAQRP